MTRLRRLLAALRPTDAWYPGFWSNDEIDRRLR